MTKEQRAYLQFELRRYQRNIKFLENFNPGQWVSSVHLQYTYFITQSIKQALADLPSEVVEVAKEKYFAAGRYSYLDLSFKLNVSERTVRRWDGQLLELVGQYMGILEVQPEGKKCCKPT